jgi:hypothetical protein
LRGAADGFPIELFVEYDDGQGFFNIGSLTGRCPTRRSRTGRAGRRVPRSDLITVISYRHMIFDYVLLVVLTLFAGAWAIPAGLQFGLNAAGVYLATALGSLLYMVAVLLAGSRAHGVLFARLWPDTGDRMEDTRARSILDRWGVPGLAAVGSVVIGPTLTLIAALLLDVDLRRFAVWYSASTVVIYGVFTVFWATLL